jgi:hypothetical protein
LTRIESFAFSYSLLQSLMIPLNVQFIKSSAFCDVNVSSITIENGNNTFAIETDLLIDIICHKLVHNFSTS